MIPIWARYGSVLKLPKHSRLLSMHKKNWHYIQWGLYLVWIILPTRLFHSTCNVFHLSKVRECKIMWSNYAIKCCYYFFSPLSQSINSFLKAKNCQQKSKCTSWVTSLKPMKFPKDWGWSLTPLHSELGKPQEYQYILCFQFVLVCISRAPQFEILKIFYNLIWNRRVLFTSI